MLKKIIIGLIFYLTLLISIKFVLFYQKNSAAREILKIQNETVKNIIDSRRPENNNLTISPLDDNGIVKILLIGLDTRVGQTSGNCDAIQLISINTKKETINITAIPRGTYSPLPPGTGTLPSDYYISNACGLAGIDYGIEQIEKILNSKPDYLVIVGFSETLGILRHLELPTTETLQWLRNRHGYAIGEPQRAHNHSTFIKQMLIKFIPQKEKFLNKALQYTLYKIVKTDLSFAQVQSIIESIDAMNINESPDKITLAIKPLYLVQDILYDSKNVSEYLDQTLGPIKHLLSKNDYSSESKETIQTKLLNIIEENKNDPEFTSWAYENNLWLQLEDKEKSLDTQHNILVAYLSSLTKKEDRKPVLVDYIIEMENRGEPVWQNKGEELLKQMISK